MASAPQAPKQGGPPPLVVPSSTGKGPAVRVEFATLGADGKAGSAAFVDWTRVRITRSLHELNGSFELEYDDQFRMAATRPPLAERMTLTQIDPLLPVKITIDGELVMTGFVEEVEWRVEGKSVRASLHGLDPGGDLIECTANPDGPAEYKGLTALQITERLVQPYGFTVTAEVDVGAPIADYALDLSESVFSALDKACKLRAILVTSNGIGGLVLTRSGSRRAPGALDTTTATSYGLKLSARERYSDYYVKGQARYHGRRGAAAPMDGASAPQTARASADPAAANDQTSRQAALLGAGHAQDPAVTRHRPRVYVARTGAGGSPHQVLAEWRMRIARARADRRVFVVPDFRAGPKAVLWRPNEVVAVHWLDEDPYDMLIEGIVFMQDAREGSRTELAVVGIEAYDLEPLPDEHHRHRNGQSGHGASVNRLPT